MAKRHLQNILVALASSERLDPLFEAEAAILGESLAKQRYRIIYGGGNNGLMGKMSAPAIARGANVTAIYPEAFAFACAGHATHIPHVRTPCVPTRLMEMTDRADALICLPGGIGTFEEIIRIMSWNDAQAWSTPDSPLKPIIIVNLKDYFTPLLALIDHAVAERMIKPNRRKMRHVVNSSREAVSLLNRLNKKAPRPLSTLNPTS